MVVAEKTKEIDDTIKPIMLELETIRHNAGGILYPKDVVSFAEDESTALHNQFEWDDTKAAYAHRIWQARHLIRTCIIVLPSTNKPIEAYVSLKADRSQDGGYRAMVEVLSDEARHKQLLADAFDDLELWESKYNQLKELSPIFKVAKRIRNKV